MYVSEKYITDNAILATAGSIVTTMVVSTVINAITNYTTKLFNKNKTNDPVQAANTASRAAMSATSKCKNTNNPEECKQKLQQLSKKWDAVSTRAKGN